MRNDPLRAYFDRLTPDASQKSRMRDRLAAAAAPKARAQRPSASGRRVWLAAPAACLLLAVLVLTSMPFGGHTSANAVINIKEQDGTVFKLSDNHKGGSGASGNTVSRVDARPGLEFYIDGKDIARIEMTTDNEYIYAVDWTKTQEEKFWNTEYYQHFDEERQVFVADFSKLYDKQLTMNFDEGFHDYDQIWFRWTAWNLYQWAARDNYSHFLGMGQVPERLSEQEKLTLAAGADGSGIGHIQLDGYPERLLEDRIKITITDRSGHRTQKTIAVKVSNNELRQTVVTARLLD